MARSRWIDSYGDWTTAELWKNDAVPTATDSAYLHLGSVHITTAISVASIKAEDITINIEKKGNCQVSGDFTQDGGLLDMDRTNLTIGGRLKVGGEFDVGTATVSAASIDSSGGLITVGGAGGIKGEIDINGPASFGTLGHLDGYVAAYPGGVIAFSGSSQITTIDKGGILVLAQDGRIADAGDLTSNSALIGLTTVEGHLALEEGAEIDAIGPLTVKAGGTISLLEGTLEDAGALRNAGTVMETGASRLEVQGTLTNSGTMSFVGKGGGGLVNVAGSTSNNGKMVFQNDSEDFSGVVAGTGSVGLRAESTLEFDKSVGRQQTFFLHTNDTLNLSDAGDFRGLVRDFNHGDAYLFDAFDTSTSFNFVENAKQTGGVLTVSDGAMDADIRMHGTYDNSDFALTAMQGGGVKISSTR